MSKQPGRRGMTALMTAEVQVPFRYRIVHGHDPSRKSAEQKALTRSINLAGLVFESKEVVKDGFHLSFTESSFGRNSLEITLDLGKKFRVIEVMAEVECYELRSSAAGETFIIGITFMDIQADDLAVLREFLSQSWKPSH